jgi:hypothetical protein
MSNEITLSYINFWGNSDIILDNYFTKFIEHNIGPCKVVSPNENPDILIASVFGNIDNITKHTAKCKIFYYGENLNRFPPYNNDDLLQKTFDLIVGFKYTNLEQKTLRFPLWLMYYDYYNYNTNYNTNYNINYNTNHIDNIISHIENKYKENIKKDKPLFATIISRHDRGGQRGKIWSSLSKYEGIKGRIKSAGDYRQNTSKIGLRCEDKINYISQSLYNICPENSVYEGYFTEKIFQAFEAGTIPLYWAIDLPEKGLINENKYCFCNVNNESELNESITNAMMYPEKYVHGNVFTENAGSIIKAYYDNLRDNIKIKLGL